MDKYIALFDLTKNEVGRLELSDNTYTIHIVSEYAHLENVLKAIGEKLKKKDTFTLKKSIDDNGIIVQTSEIIKKDDERYACAVASYVNNRIRTTPRIIAVVKTVQEVQS